MFVSAPIPQILQKIAEEMDNQKAREKLFDVLYELESTDIKVRMSVTQNLYNKIIKRSEEYDFIYHFLCFLSQYFVEKENNKLTRLVAEAVSELEPVIIENENVNLLCGLFTSPMLSDPKDMKGLEFDIPEQIRQAMEYIRSEGYKVYVDKEK